MLFELHNGATDRISHCGVLEFVAEEGMIIMPYWVCAISELLLLLSSVVLPEKYISIIHLSFTCIDDAKHASSRG
jgi:hypothetical protein